MSFKKKFENFWYYHKWHTVFAIGIIAFVSMISYQMMTKTDYDNEIVVAGNVPATLSDYEAFVEDVKHCFKDVDSDGQVNLAVTFVPFGSNIGSGTDPITDAEAAIAYPQQFQALLAADDANIFIVTEDIIIDYSDDNAFADISKLQKELKLDEKYPNAVRIRDFELIKELNLYADVDYYVAVRVHDDLSSMGKEKRIKYENAYAFVREIVNSANNG